VPIFVAPLAAQESDTVPISQKITDTNIQETPIITRPIAACLRIPIPFLYFASSPAAVTIWNPHQRQIIKAIRASIPKIQFTALVIVLSNEELSALVVALAVHQTLIPLTPFAAPNPPGFSQPLLAEAIPTILPNAANPIIVTASNFVFMFSK